MPYSLCDMDCDQEINKSVLEGHCSDCLCVGGLVDLDRPDVPVTKAWRPTSVVEERNRLKTLSKPGEFVCIAYVNHLNLHGVPSIMIIIKQWGHVYTCSSST